MMDKIEIDDLTGDYYKAISFRNEHAPDLSAVQILFYNEGILVNNSFQHPVGFSAVSFVTALESEIAAGSMTQYLIHELHARTEIYGKLELVYMNTI